MQILQLYIAVLGLPVLMVPYFDTGVKLKVKGPQPTPKLMF